MNQFSSTSNSGKALPQANQTLNLETIRTFVAICETGTFRRAAARVNRSPSAISIQIAKLEEQLGAKLLTRDARRVQLTEQGSVLLGYARRLLGISNEALAVFQGAPLAGHLRLAAPHDLGVTLVPDLLHRLATSHPHVVVDVRLDTAEAVQDRFLNGDVNLALFNEVRDPALQLDVLYSEPLVWMMKDGGNAVERDPLPLAIAEIDCAWRQAALEALEAACQDFRIAYSSDTSLGQIAALRADLAIAALPASLASEDLVEVPKEIGLPPLPKTYVYLANDGSDLAATFAKIVMSIK